MNENLNLLWVISAVAILFMACVMLFGCVGGDGDVTKEYVWNIDNDGELVLQVDNTTSGGSSGVEMTIEDYDDLVGGGII